MENAIHEDINNEDKSFKMLEKIMTTIINSIIPVIPNSIKKLKGLYDLKNSDVAEKLILSLIPSIEEETLLKFSDQNLAKENFKNTSNNSDGKSSSHKINISNSSDKSYDFDANYNRYLNIILILDKYFQSKINTPNSTNEIVLSKINKIDLNHIRLSVLLSSNPSCQSNDQLILLSEYLLILTFYSPLKEKIHKEIRFLNNREQLIFSSITKKYIVEKESDKLLGIKRSSDSSKRQFKSLKDLKDYYARNINAKLNKQNDSALSNQNIIPIKRAMTNNFNQANLNTSNSLSSKDSDFNYLRSNTAISNSSSSSSNINTYMRKVSKKANHIKKISLTNPSFPKIEEEKDITYEDSDLSDDESKFIQSMYKITDEHKDRNSNNNNEDNNDNELSELNDINNTNDMNNITSKSIYQCGNNENTGEDSLITFSPRNHSKSRVSNTFKLSEISNIQNSLYNASNNNISLINNINSDNDLNFINSYSHNQSKSVLKETEDNYTVNTLNNNSDNEKKKDKKVKYLSTVTLLDSEKESSYNLSHLSCFNSENDEKNKVVKFNLNNMLEHSKKNKADMGRYVNEEHDKINFSNLVLDDLHNKKNDTDRTSRTNKTNMTNMTNMSNSKYSKHSKHSKESCFRSISAKTSNAELEYSQTITEDKNTINTERSNNSIVIETIKRMNSNIISEGLKDYLIQNINSGENKLTSNNRILNDKRKSIINAKNTQGFIKSSKKRSYSVFKKPSSSGLSGFGSILDCNKHSKNNSKEKYSNKND